MRKITRIFCFCNTYQYLTEYSRQKKTPKAQKCHSILHLKCDVNLKLYFTK